MTCLLVVDIGNTQTVFGLYRGTGLTCHWRLSSEPNKTADELSLQLNGMFTQNGIDVSDIHGILAASVVPHLDAVLTRACQLACNKTPAFVGSADVKTGMAVDYKNPREVGSDRIANAVAAREHFGSPVIVMDCGTATTFDIVSPVGHYAGGLIVPGMEVALSALSERAAKLPEVTSGRLDILIARDTASSMQAGSYWSTVDGLTGIIRRLHSLPGFEHAPVVASGGLAEEIIADIEGISACRPDLTLEGLRLLATQHFV